MDPSPPSVAAIDGACLGKVRNVPLPAQAGASCGVVGRTGSGKSSLMLALFRLIDVTAGRVLLDGLDVASIGLGALRRQLAIIPQVCGGVGGLYTAGAGNLCLTSTNCSHAQS